MLSFMMLHLKHFVGTIKFNPSILSGGSESDLP